MWNPFKAPMQLVSYSPSPNTLGPDTGESVHANTIELDNDYYPDVLIGPGRASVGDTTQQYLPAYAGKDVRELVQTPGIVYDYKFRENTDASQHVPGTVSLNYMDGPVTGKAMDHFQEGNVQRLAATPPGSHGPVKGGQDYSQVAYATWWQQQFALQSNAASVEAHLAAI